MSGLYENRKSIRILNTMINEYMPTSEVEYYFILGYPRSDIGKGTLVAQLLSIVPKSDAIKFDGLLNTNENGRHTAIGHDDFGVYEKFNPGKRWSNEHYLLGGELYRDFINKFGEYENLQINPHMSLYVEYCINKMWNDIGKPKVLFIEVGGLITDPEVDPIFTPIIQRSIERGNGKVILLSESSYNGEYIKTKTIQSSMKVLLERRLEPWLLVARDPNEMETPSLSERLNMERVISNKIYDSFNFKLTRIITVPYFDNLNHYSEYMSKRFLPFITKLNKNIIMLATKNSSKIADFKLYLGDEYEIKTIKDFDFNIDVEEGMTSIEENAVAKARAWATSTNLISIGDDTGFFIHSLNGEPGVAVRRWAGELKEEATNEDFWKYLQEKTKPLSDLSCHFEQCAAVVAPNGKIVTVRTKNEGYINKEKLARDYNGSGYPLALAFESINRNKTWDEMTDEEKKIFDKAFITDLKSTIKNIIKD